jgi:O-antigen/teichoic acid export membrane protein
MSGLKKLAQETVIYGLSSIVGKFLNWLLVPLYTFVLAQQSDYGIVTNLYAWTALLLVILTYGMETGFFRFANRDDQKPNRVYTTALTSVGTTSLIFAVCCVIFKQPIASLLGYANHAEFISMLAIVVAMDAFASIPFAYLRYKRQAVRFAALKLLFVVLNIALNLFFLLACPRIMQTNPELIDWFYRPDYGVGYVFVANIMSTAIQTLCLLPAILAEKYDFSWSTLRQMLHYSLPLLILGIVGIMNQTVDKILFPFLYTAGDAQAELGIYGACFKIAMVMMMFTQAFRYAYEPFVFARHKDRNSVEAYADVMKYYIIASLFILLGMIFFLDLLKLIISPDYWSGLRVVPIVLFSYIFQGIFFNLSLWYKLTDKTIYGTYFSVLGCAITLTINVLLVPTMSYMASAWASFACYLTIMIVSYLVGQHHLKVPYDLRSILGYFALALALLGIYELFLHYFESVIWACYIVRVVLLGVFALVVYRFEWRKLKLVRS